MSRTPRLHLLRVLRHHTGPIGGPELAERLWRTLYQDIAARALSPDA